MLKRLTGKNADNNQSPKFILPIVFLTKIVANNLLIKTLPAFSLVRGDIFRF